MDDINVNSSSGTTPATNTSIPSSTAAPLSTSSQVADSIAAAIAAESNNSLSIFNKLAQPNYLNTWTAEINTSIQESKDLINANTTSEILAFRGVRLSAIISAEGFIGIRTKIDEIANRMQSVYDQQQTARNALKSSIDTYNEAIAEIAEEDQDRIDTMNAAITAYKNSDKGTAATTTYNNAITAYNTYVNTTRVTAYNNAKNILTPNLNTYQTAVNDLNAEIDEINDLRQEVGIPNMSSAANAPSVPGQTAMPAAPSTTNTAQLADATDPTPVAVPAAPTAPPSADDLYTQYITPVLNAALSTNQAVDNFTNMLARLNDFIRYYLGPEAGKVSSLPNAFIDQTSPTFIDRSTGVGSGAGASLTSMVTGLSNLNLNRILSNSIANDAIQQELLDLNQPQQDIDNVRLLNLTLLTRTALYSAVSALDTLSAGSITQETNSTVAQAALSLGFIKQIAALANSDELEKAILKQLQTSNPEADAEKLARLASLLAASSNLSFALFATTQLSQALKSSDLTNQLIGLVNTPATNNALLSSNRSTINDIVNNPLDLASLKDHLAKSLSRDNDQADDIIRSLSLSEAKSADQLKQAVNDQLIKKGVSPEQASVLARQASDFAEAKVDQANAQNESIQRDYLNKQLQSKGINDDIIAKVLPEITPSSFSNQAELNAKVQQSLIDAGLDAATAQQAANSISGNDSSGILTSRAVSRAQFADNLTARINADGEGSSSQLQGLSSSLVSALIDESHPLSMTNIIRTNIEKLNAIDDDLVAENIRNFIKPTYDLYDFNIRVMDPANSLLLGIWSGPMYDTNFKYTKSIDIIV